MGLFEMRGISYEPAHEIMAFITKANSECSGDPAHPRSLARAFAVREHEIWKLTKGPTKNRISRPYWMTAHARFKNEFTEDESTIMS